MKFKRGINLVLKNNQNVVTPRGESWRYLIFSGDKDGDFEVLANSSAPGKDIYTQVYSVAGTKLRSVASIYITGAAFTAD